MHSLLQYNGPIFTSDSNNTANAAVERDNSGNINVSGVNASTYLAALCMFLSGKSFTSNFTCDETFAFAKVNASSAAVTATLPPVASASDQTYVFWKTDSSTNDVTVKGNGSDNIMVGSTIANTTNLTTQGQCLRLWCDGTQWYAW